jgi:hypothetical protein
MTNTSSFKHHFRDKRPPHEVQFTLERELRVLFTTTMEQDKLCMRAKANIVGVAYEFLLRFEAASHACNDYTLLMDVLWSHSAISNFEYYGKTAGSWFELWTRDFELADPPRLHDGDSQLYFQLCNEALNAEHELNSVDAIQLAIVSAMKRGATFRAAHKEGGTNIYWKNDRFVRSDYGDFPDETQFKDEAEFLKMLRQFLHWDVNQNSGQEHHSEIDTWRLMMRRMYLP